MTDAAMSTGEVWCERCTAWGWPTKGAAAAERAAFLARRGASGARGPAPVVLMRECAVNVWHLLYRPVRATPVTGSKIGP